MSIEQQFQKILTVELNKFVDKGLNDKLLKKVGNEAKNQIVKRTRLGKGVKTPGGAAIKLLPLKDSTIDYRDNYDNNLSPYTRPPRSNLTATGQLLDSIAYRIIKKTKSKIIQLFFKENRRFELDGKPARIKHNKLSQYVQKDRPFFYLANFELNKIKSILFNALYK